MDTDPCVPKSATGGSRRCCRFEIDDEEAAFAYAEERVRATPSRLRGQRTGPARRAKRIGAAMHAHDVDAAVSCVLGSVHVRRSSTTQR